MPSKQKAPHHRGSFHRLSAQIRASAYANPATTCWRCGRTLQQVRERKPRAIWTAGHIFDGIPNSPLMAECSPCNYSHGAVLGNRSPKRRRSAAWRPPPPRVTDLTW